MTPKKQMNIRISDYTRQQVEALQAHLGLGEELETQTRIIAVAIDRLYKEEYPMRTDNDIFDMYANQADPDLLRKMSDERIAADLREVDYNLSQGQAEKYAQAIRKILNNK
ncbi:MAG TPA: hypothetical protein VIH42_13745 [Thermoguttaceae bacterium]